MSPGLNQAVVQNLDYLPFGELNSSDSGISTHKFTGDEHDSETNLDHTQFRQYSSSLARWMHPDPAGLAAVDPTDPQSWNRYAYVRNNPLSLIDPLGLTPGCSTAENYDPNEQWNLKSGGPFAADGAPAEPDPQHPTGGCGYLPGVGISMDGADITDIPGLLGSGASFAICPDSGCRMDNNGNFIGPVYVPNGHYAADCYGPFANPTANCGNLAWISQGYHLGITGNQFDSDDQWIRALGGQVVAGAGGIGDWRFIGGFYALSAAGGFALVDAGAAGLGAGADDITTLSRVYRVFGGDSQEFGMSWTPYNPSELPFYAQDAGLPIGNTAEYVIRGELPLSAQVGVRAALPYGGVGGGLTEFLISNARNIIVWTRVTPF